MAEPERTPTPAAEQTAAAAAPAVTHYSLSEVPIEALADLAPTLKEAEFRIYTELMRQEMRTGAAVTASSRQLATTCKIARSKAIPAIDSLTKRGLLTTRQGSGNRTTIYQVNALQTTSMSGPFRGPLTPDRWSLSGTAQVPLWDRTGPRKGPPPTESKELAPAGAAVDLSTALPPEIDRVLSSKPSDHDPQLLAFTRRYIQSHMQKMGVDDNNRRFLDTGQAAPTPTDKEIAQILAVAESSRLFACLDNLVREPRHHPYRYFWFVTVTLQRIHGIHFTVTREAVKPQLVKRGQRAAPPAPAAQPGQLFENPPLEERTDTAAMLRQATAGVRNLR